MTRKAWVVDFDGRATTDNKVFERNEGETIRDLLRIIADNKSLDLTEVSVIRISTIEFVERDGS